MELLSLIVLAVVLFVSTNIDDIFVLLGFFADPKFRAPQIAVGQVVGIAALFGVSVVGSLVSLLLPPAYIGLLGVLPILIGLKKLWDLRIASTDPALCVRPNTSQGFVGKAAAVAAVTIANGGDNIGVYTPLFATKGATEVAVIGAVFLALTTVWLMAAHALVNHPTLGAPIRNYGHRIVPFVLIGLGLLILKDAGSFALLSAR